MGKLFAPLALVLFAGMTDDQAATISINPKPPSVGETCTLTYTGPCPTTLVVTIFPSGEVVRVAITAGGTGTFAMPDGESYTISDPSGAARAIGGSINP